MEDFEEIRNAIEGNNDNTIKDENTSEGQIIITSTDPVETLNARVSMLMAKNADLELKVKRLEDIVSGLVAGRSSERTKPRISLPRRDLFGPKPPPDMSSNVSIASSVTDTPASRAGSVSGYSSHHTPEFSNPFATMSTPEGPRLIVTKSSSATAAMGYDRKASVWGTALASMLISATRYYITKTNAAGILVDEVRLMRNCTNIAPVLYNTSMHRDLPGVKDGTTKYLSESISRVDKNEVPVSTAEDWLHMEQNQFGKDVLTVLNNLIIIAKEVPEVIMHPVSQIVSILVPPVVREVDGVVKFAMYAQQPVNPVPNQWERWCLVLKDTALTKYTKYRLSGLSSGNVMSKMTNEMRQSDLVEKKNLARLTEMRMPTAEEF